MTTDKRLSLVPFIYLSQSVCLSFCLAQPHIHTYAHTPPHTLMCAQTHATKYAIDTDHGVIYWSLRHRAAVLWESLAINLTGFYRRREAKETTKVIKLEAFLIKRTQLLHSEASQRWCWSWSWSWSCVTSSTSVRFNFRFSYLSFYEKYCFSCNDQLQLN